MLLLYVRLLVLLNTLELSPAAPQFLQDVFLFVLRVLPLCNDDLNAFELEGT